jgi:hypothetical protein
MSDILKRSATPFITGLFLISLISGVALFFHLGAGAFRGMHEWLSMALILPFALHLWKNWRALMNYVGRVPFTIAMVASLAAALAFAVPSGTGGADGPPQFAFSHAILSNAPEKVAPLLGVSTEKLVEELQAKGFSAASPALSLTDIATKSGKDEFELVAALLPANP